MTLTIISPDYVRDFNVVWIELYTAIGTFVIQKGHVPMVLMLAPDQPILFGLKNGKQETVTIAHGIAEITRTNTTIIAHTQ